MITEYSLILQKLELLKPSKYAKSRNYVDGDVSKLSCLLYTSDAADES